MMNSNGNKHLNILSYLQIQSKRRRAAVAVCTYYATYGINDEHSEMYFQPFRWIKMRHWSALAKKIVGTRFVALKISIINYLMLMLKQIDFKTKCCARHDSFCVRRNAHLKTPSNSLDVIVNALHLIVFFKLRPIQMVDQSLTQRHHCTNDWTSLQLIIMMRTMWE